MKLLVTFFLVNSFLGEVVHLQKRVPAKAESQKLQIKLPRNPGDHVQISSDHYVKSVTSNKPYEIVKMKELDDLPLKTSYSGKV